MEGILNWTEMGRIVFHLSHMGPLVCQLFFQALKLLVCKSLFLSHLCSLFKSSDIKLYSFMINHGIGPSGRKDLNKDGYIKTC